MTLKAHLQPLKLSCEPLILGVYGFHFPLSVTLAHQVFRHGLTPSVVHFSAVLSLNPPNSSPQVVLKLSRFVNDTTQLIPHQKITVPDQLKTE